MLIQLFKYFIFTSLIFLCIPQPAYAHIIGVQGQTMSGFYGGLIHPISGLDHTLAAIAIGLWSGNKGKLALIVPVLFSICMLIGCLIGLSSIHIPLVEIAIAFSVIVFGIMLMITPNTGYIWPYGLTSLFGLFHGHAHGTEYVTIGETLNYSVGLFLSTAAICCSGIILAKFINKTLVANKILQFSGLVLTIIGSILLNSTL